MKKIKVKAKNKEDKLKAFLLEKECNNWLNHKDNKKMMEDYVELCQECVFFRIKWGLPVEIVIGDIEKPSGMQ